MATEDEIPTPPYSLDLLSDLHAGVLPESVSARLWPRVRRDPDAMHVIEQLDAITMELSELGTDETVESPMPDAVASRMDAALAAASSGATSSDDNVIRFPRRRRAWAATAAVTAAAAAIAVVAAAVVLPAASTDNESSDTGSVALPSSTSEPAPELDFTGEPEPGRMMTLIGSRNLGPLDEAASLSDCLQANGIDESRPILGSGQVRVEGREGTAILLAGPHPPTITALVVGNECGAGNPDLISRNDIG